jgi:hypothetical protein
MKLVHSQQISEKQKKQAVENHRLHLAWSFSMRVWSTLLLAAYDRLPIFAG